MNHYVAFKWCVNGFMGDCIIFFVEQEFLDAIPNDDTIVHFQNMDDRTLRVKLYKR